MKKLIIALSVLIGAQAYASDYPYLTFQTADGARYSFESGGISIGVSGNILTIRDREFNLTNLSKMYFSTSDETSGIENVLLSDIDDNAEIYDLSGQRVAKNRMTHGVYLIKNGDNTYKIAVR